MLYCKKSLLLLGSIACLSLSYLSSVNVSASSFNIHKDIFSYDKQNTSGCLHVTLSGTTQPKSGDSPVIQWSAQNVKTSDCDPYHAQIFGNPKVMTYYGNKRPWTKEYTQTRIGTWTDRFSKGQPHGALTVREKDTEQLLGCIVAGGGDRPGTAEVAYAFRDDVHGKGIGASTLGEIVHTWAPRVRHIGESTGLQGSDAEMAQKFRCFGEKSLQQLDATASPANIASWKILEKHDFKPAKCGVHESNCIDLSDLLFRHSKENNLEQYYKELEEYLTSADLTPGKRYVLIEADGKSSVVSVSNAGKVIKFHYENTDFKK